MAEKKKGPRLIWGARAIGQFIGVDKAKAFYLLQKGRIPARKVGGEWVAEKGSSSRSSQATQPIRKWRARRPPECALWSKPQKRIWPPGCDPATAKANLRWPTM